ncbi:MAG: protein kinase [Blastocatellia bacterium]|nr:protein kinase [Blastocatellia bacterium]
MNNQFIGKVLAEKYRIDSLMREGALGNLYQGTHLLMEKPVCIKILPPALAVDEAIVNNFAREARTVSRISHPNILSVTDYGTDSDGTVFIVFEDATGETLKDIIGRIGKLSLKRANRVIQEIESALTVAHNNGIIHQNLTSENILIQPIGNNSEAIKILNFGTAPFDINDLDYPVEKAQYLSPEQCSNTKEVDVRSDVYALGVILYEMLAGEVPLKAPTTTDLMLKHLQETPPPIDAFRDDLPTEVDDILLSALAKNPEIRYQTVNEFAEELNKVSLLAKDTDETETMFIPAVSSVLPSNSVAVTPEKPQNNLWKTAFIVLAGITLLGASFIYLTSGKQTNPTTTLQTDANGMPVQPVNPATGATEQGLANMNDFNPNLYSNTNTGLPDGGGGINNPYWDNGTRPPGMTSPAYGPPIGSAPYPVMPSNSGPTVYVDPANGSIFMPTENNTYVQMVPANKGNSNVNSQPTQKRNSNSNVNTATVPSANTTAKPSPTPPVANTAIPADGKPKATPSPKATSKPTEAKPKATATPPSTTDKRPVSGKEQDTSQF